MEIDIKKEITRVQGEIQELSAQGNLLGNNITTLQQQRQEVINQVLMKQGELNMLQRMSEVSDEQTRGKEADKD